MRNYELIKKVYDHIVNNPESHDQGVWAMKTNSCGTVACAAGHALIFSGLDIEWEVIPAWGPGGATREDVARMRFVTMPDGRRETISVGAREVMGLTRAAATKLFFHTTEEEAIDMLEDMLEEDR